MRATIPLAGAPLLLLLAGCSNVEKLAEVPLDCTLANTVLVTYGSGGIEVDKECIRVALGSEVTLTFMPPPAVNQARTKYTGLGNRWLDKHNDNQADAATIKLRVPSDEDKRRNRYKYDIRIKGFESLDPRIVIQ